MYAYIKGKLVSIESDAIIVETGGIGYRIFTADSLIPAFGAVDSDIIVFTKQIVREDDISLYGFPTKASMQMFSLLLGVSGVGPKVAAAVMGTLTPDAFALAVMTEDIKTITTVKGLGKKGAERLILELRDKFKGLTWDDAGQLPLKGAVATDATDPRTEVLSALIVLGYSNTEALNLVKQSYDAERSLQDNIRMALKAAAK